MEFSGRLDPDECRFLFSGPQADVPDAAQTKPPATWLPLKARLWGVRSVSKKEICAIGPASVEIAEIYQFRTIF